MSKIDCACVSALKPNYSGPGPYACTEVIVASVSPPPSGPSPTVIPTPPFVTPTGIQNLQTTTLISNQQNAIKTEKDKFFALGGGDIAKVLGGYPTAIYNWATSSPDGSNNQELGFEKDGFDTFYTVGKADEYITQEINGKKCKVIPGRSCTMKTENGCPVEIIDQRCFMQYNQNGEPLVPTSWKKIEELTQKKGRIYAIDNEPDLGSSPDLRGLETTTNGGSTFIDPKQYAKWYKTFRDKIKKLDPDAKVMIGGLAFVSIGTSETDLDNFTGTDPAKNFTSQYIKIWREEYKRLYNTYPEVDIWNIHLYPRTSNWWIGTDGGERAGKNAVAQLRVFRNYLNSIGEGEKPIWISETAMLWVDPPLQRNGNQLVTDAQGYPISAHTTFPQFASDLNTINQKKQMTLLGKFKLDSAPTTAIRDWEFLFCNREAPTIGSICLYTGEKLKTADNKYKIGVEVCSKRGTCSYLGSSVGVGRDTIDHNFALVWDGKTIKLYIDVEQKVDNNNTITSRKNLCGLYTSGILPACDTKAFTGTFFVPNASLEMDGTTNRPFPGKVFETMLFDVALEDPTLLSYFNYKNGKYSPLVSNSPLVLRFLGPEYSDYNYTVQNDYFKYIYGTMKKENLAQRIFWFYGSIQKNRPWWQVTNYRTYDIKTVLGDWANSLNEISSIGRYYYDYAVLNQDKTPPTLKVNYVSVQNKASLSTEDPAGQISGYEWAYGNTQYPTAQTAWHRKYSILSNNEHTFGTSNDTDFSNQQYVYYRAFDSAGNYSGYVSINR